MPKAISNVDRVDEYKLFPSLICKLISQGQVSPDQVYGCSLANGTCVSAPTLAGCPYSACMISQCRKISTLDTCQKRTDANANRVCEWKNDYFCVSTPSTSDFRGDYYEALKWAVSRNKLEESINATSAAGSVFACCSEAGCQLDSGKGCSTNGYVTAGDLFAKTYTHNFKNIAGESFDRHPLGEVCEGFVVTSTVTMEATVAPSDYSSLKEQRNGLAAGTAVGGLGSLVLISVIFLRFFLTPRFSQLFHLN